MKSALTVFVAELDELDLSLAFIEAAEKLKPRLGEVVRWEALEGPNEKLVTDFQKSEWNSRTICEGMLVRLTSCFEEFLRKLIQATVLKLNGKGMSFEKLGRVLQYSNRHAVGLALSTIHTGNEVVDFDFDRICRELGTCLPGTKTVLSGDAISFFRGGVTKERIEKCFARIGATVNWDDVGRSSEIQNAVGESTMKKASNKTIVMIEEARKARNRLAHRGVGGEVLETDDVRRWIVFYRSLALELNRQLDVHVSSFS